jgi:hypothetical protein
MVGARRAYDFALAGALAAVVGLYLFVGLSQVDPTLASSPDRWARRDLLAGALLGGAIGYVLRGFEAARDGAFWRASRRAASGLVMGALGGAAGLVMGELAGGGVGAGLVGRAISWGLLGAVMGAGLGALDRSRERAIQGLLGGAIGGLAGGLVFEALRDRAGASYEPATGQALGIVLLGLGLGLGLAVAEQVLRRAWLVVLNGHQEGRMFTLSDGVARVGLDERAEVGLFGDLKVARRHARIVGAAGHFALHPGEDSNGRLTRVNGLDVTGSVTLQDGDRVELGATSLMFRCRGRDGPTTSSSSGVAMQ